MQYVFSKGFEKKFKKLSKKIKDKAIVQINLLIEDEMDYSLNNHSLNGEWSSYRSINITGDVRLIYKKENKDIIRIITIGTHSELYE